MLLASIGFIYLSVGITAFPFLLIDFVVVFAGSRLVEKTQKASAKRWILVIALIIIVGQLVALKYYNNMTSWINKALVHLFNIQLPQWNNSWIAPIGISYFSLSAIGYVLDVYWGTCKAEKNPLKIALFISWFPALVSGPIVKYREQKEQLFVPHTFSYLSLKFGFERVLWGLFKKMVIADRLAVMTSTIFADTVTYPGVYVVVAVLLFAFQIYCDFSGCMDIVLGASEMFQITLPENFKRPFFSHNLAEFWRRWHITLGIWAKEYVMYPLLKSRLFQTIGSKTKKLFGKKLGKNIPTYIGMLILWVVIGIWHGGSAKYIFAAGILPWILIVGGQLLQPAFDGTTRLLRIKKDCFSYRLFSSLRTLALMCLIWLFAMTAGGVFSGVTAIKHTIRFNPWVLFDGSLYGLGLDAKDFSLLSISLLLVLVVSYLKEKGHQIRQELEQQNIIFQWIVLLIGIFSVLIFGIYGPGYNPADFIYAGF